MNELLDVPTSKQFTSEKEVLLDGLLTRLSSVLTDENRCLEGGASVDHSIYIVSKNQVLRELMAVHRGIDLKTLGPDMLEKLKETRKLVDRNHELLKLQVSALNDVTAFLTQTAISEQSDGTYTRERQ